MTFMRPHDAEFLKQAIKDQIAPLLERIEKLEAELKNRERGNRFCKQDDCPYPDCLVEGGVCGSLAVTRPQRDTQ